MAKSQLRQWLEQKRRIRERKELIKNNTSHDHQMTLRQVLIRYFQSKIKVVQPKEATQDEPVNMLPRTNITHIAIVLNGVVQDVMRTEDRMASLLLAQPEFVEFDPKEMYPILGTSTYQDGKWDSHYVKEQLDPNSVVQDFDIFEYLDDEDREEMKKLSGGHNV